MGSGMVIAFPYPRPSDRNGRHPRATATVGPWTRTQSARRLSPRHGRQGGRGADRYMRLGFGYQLISGRTGGWLSRAGPLQPERQRPGADSPVSGASHTLPSIMGSYRIYDRTDQLGTVGKVAPGLFAPRGSVLADDPRESSRLGRALPRAGGMGRAVETPRRLDEGVVVRADRHEAT